MTVNANFRFDDVAVISLAACEASEVVTSAEVDDRLADYYDRTDTSPGLLQSLAGIDERRQWPEGCLVHGCGRRRRRAGHRDARASIAIVSGSWSTPRCVGSDSNRRAR